MRHKESSRCRGKSIPLVIGIFLLSGTALFLFFPILGKSQIRNVLIISLDTTRADHLGCYGFDKPTTPHIDALAAEGVLFEQAVSPVALTLPAHASAFTGTHPPFHHVHDNHAQPLSLSHVTLAELLSERGFATGAVVSCYVLRKEVQLDQGFTVYDDRFDEASGTGTHLERKGGEATRHVNAYLTEHQDVPFCLLAHYYDPHHKYAPPEPFASRYPDNPYAGEIAYMDQCVGEVIQQLKDLQLYDSTLIVVMGDHGEGLGEHVESEHGYYLYQNTNHVPLIIRAPGERGGERVGHPVSLVDVMPTILGYLDIPIPEHVQGKDLSGSHRGVDSAEPRYVYAEAMTPILYGCNPLLGLVGNGWKYIDSTRPELYDLETDPGEKINLYQSEPRRAGDMQAELTALIGRLYRPEGVTENTSFDAESVRRLKSLGYLGSENMEASFDVDSSRPDAKDLVKYHIAYRRVFELIDDNNPQAAYQICQKILEDFPQITKTHFVLGDVSYHCGNWQQCIRHLQTYMELVVQDDQSLEKEFLNPDKSLFTAEKRIAQSYLKLGQPENSVQHYRAMVSYDFEQDAVHKEFGIILTVLEDYEGAVYHFLKSLEFHSDHSDVADTHDKLAGAFYALGRMEDAKKHIYIALQTNPNSEYLQTRRDSFEKIRLAEAAVAVCLEAVRRDPDDAESHDKLAGTFFLQKKMALAVQHWKELIRLRPDDYEPLNNLAWVLATTGNDDVRDPQQAVEFAERAAEMSQFQQVGVLDTLAMSYAAAGNFARAEEIATKAMALATADGNQEMAAALKAHLELYRNQQTYRD